MRVYLHLFLMVLYAHVAPAFVGAQLSPSKEAKEPSPSAGPNDNKNVLTVLQGSVLDADGQPLADVEVNALESMIRSTDDPQAGSMKTVVLAKATTDQQGRFRMDVRQTATPQDLSLVAFRAGQSLGWCFLSPGKDMHDVTLPLSRPVRVSGTVLDPGGRPLPRVAVKLCSIRSTAMGVDPWFLFLSLPELLSAWPRPSVTRDNGTFSLEGISPHTEVIVEIDDERVARQKWRFLIDQDASQLVINTQPNRDVVGQVVIGEAGTPAAATVVLTSWNKGEHFGAVNTITDAQGYFRVRPFASDRLEIRVVPSGDTTYQLLQRRIPWPSGTTTQRMVLTLREKGWESIDGTTRDGRPASTIDADYPTAKVEPCQPAEPLTDKLSGTIVAAVFIAKSVRSEKSPFSGLIAIEPNSGRWRVLTSDGISHSPRISPDGNCLAFVRVEPSELNLLALQPVAAPRQIATEPVDLAIWGVDGKSLFVSVSKPAQRDYYGEMYWGREREAWKIDNAGVKQHQIPVPPLYDLYDVSHDGNSIVMHYDTHASLTGAQLFIAHADGRGLTPLARKKSQYYWYPHFHPTDKSVCAKHLDARTGRLSIRVIAVDGSQERSIILPDQFGPETACWSPDGRSLAVAAYQSAAFRGGPKIGSLFIVDESGTHFRQVALENVEQARIYNVEWTAADLVAK